MYHGVTSVVPVENHKLIIGFDNGERRVFDVSPLLDQGRFRDLIPTEVFRTAHVDFDTVAWGNGLDLDPEYLYERSEVLPDSMLFLAE